MIRRNVLKIAALLLASISAHQVFEMSVATAANAAESAPVLAVIATP